MEELLMNKENSIVRNQSMLELLGNHDADGRLFLCYT